MSEKKEDSIEKIIYNAINEDIDKLDVDYKLKKKFKEINKIYFDIFSNSEFRFYSINKFTGTGKTTTLLMWLDKLIEHGKYDSFFFLMSEYENGVKEIKEIYKKFKLKKKPIYFKGRFKSCKNEKLISKYHDNNLNFNYFCKKECLIKDKCEYYIRKKQMKDTKLPVISVHKIYNNTLIYYLNDKKKNLDKIHEKRKKIAIKKCEEDILNGRKREEDIFKVKVKKDLFKICLVIDENIINSLKNHSIFNKNDINKHVSSLNYIKDKWEKDDKVKCRKIKFELIDQTIEILELFNKYILNEEINYYELDNKIIPFTLNLTRFNEDHHYSFQYNIWNEVSKSIIEGDYKVFNYKLGILFSLMENYGYERNDFILEFTNPFFNFEIENHPDDLYYFIQIKRLDEVLRR